MYWHLVYLVLKVLAWEVCNIELEFAKKTHNTVTNLNYILSNFYESDVTSLTLFGMTKERKKMPLFSATKGQLL